MFDFLTPELFDALVWAVILIGGAMAIVRLLRDLNGPPRWPEDAAPRPSAAPLGANDDQSPDEDQV